MKTNIFIMLLAGFLSTNLHAQSPPNNYFLETSFVPCPFDSSQMILQADYWQIYQTLNDEWDGPIDSTKCISLIGNTHKVNLDQVDPAKPFFIKSLIDDDTKIWLEQDWLYLLQGIANLSPNPPLNISGDCANGLCSGVILGIEIPNEDTTGTNLRIHPVSFQDFGACDANTCIPTEKFADNYLREFIFKFTFDTTDLTGVFVQPNSAYMEASWDFSTLTETVVAGANDYNTSDSTYHLEYWSLPNIWSESALVLHTDTTYPSPEHISFIDFTVEPNQPGPQKIQLTIDDWNSLIFQPYTSFRGGLVEDNDSIRHHFNLVNNGGQLCLQFIEVSFGSGEQFIYKSGSVDFSSPFACLQFMHGGKLVVADNSTFHYGNNGLGMLALRQGGTIELGNNSTLIIDNTLFMYESGTHIPQQIYMTLNSGSSLIFGAYSHISNKYSINKAMKLNVYMNGGVLDDRNLSAEERALINRIYPPEHKKDQDNSLLFPNPANSYITWIYHSSYETEVRFLLYDTNGRLIQRDKHQVVIGPNEIPVDIRAFNDGLYYLHWNTDTENGVKKWVKQ